MSAGRRRTAISDSVLRYRPAARVLHWLTALLVFAVWPLGKVIGFVREEVKLDFYLLHESLGFLVLWIMLARLGVRLTNPPPPQVPMPALQRRAANTVHILLYAALIAMPVTGFLATNAHGFPLDWFGILPVWSPIGPSPAVAPALSAVHYALGWAVLALVLLHVAGALYHHVFRRDETLQRML